MDHIDVAARHGARIASGQVTGTPVVLDTLTERARELVLTLAERAFSIIDDTQALEACAELNRVGKAHVLLNGRPAHVRRYGSAHLAPHGDRTPADPRAA